MPDTWIAIVVPSLAAGAFGIATAFITAKLTGAAERRRAERESKTRLETQSREFAAKYAELIATNPTHAEAVREQFAGAYLHITNMSALDIPNRFFIPRDARVVIGRRGDIQLPDDARSMSLQHASIQLVGDEAFLDDLGSTNGTCVNGRPISGRTRLLHGDLVRFGAVDAIFRKL
jgi:FHA domain